MRVWTIGSGGLLGRAVVADVHAREGWSVYPGPAIDWMCHPDELAVIVGAAVTDLESSDVGESWGIVWAAGGSTVAATELRTALELAQFNAAAAAIRRTARTPGRIFVASSAGAVYAGSSTPPFTEQSDAVALSPYGRLKLAMESDAAKLFSGTSHSVVIGRMTNLYGPNQRLDKRQGLISHLAIARLGGPPAMIYVPLDTVRDYLYADDAAALALDALARGSDGEVATKNLASGDAVSISFLLGTFQRVTKRRIPVVLGIRPESALQPRDLRVTSTVWPDLDARDFTSLPAGVRLTLDGVLASAERGGVRANG